MCIVVGSVERCSLRGEGFLGSSREGISLSSSLARKREIDRSRFSVESHGKAIVGEIEALRRRARIIGGGNGELA